MPDQTNRCPECGYEIALTEAITRQIERVLFNAAGMYDNLQGISGDALPPVKTLEFLGTRLEIAGTCAT